MPRRFGWGLAAVTLAACGLILAAPGQTLAQTLQIRASIDGGPFTLDVLDNSPQDSNPAIGIIALGSTTTPINFGGLLVLGSVSTSDKPGFSALSQLASSSLSVTNTTGAAHTVVLQISDNGFTLPPSPLAMLGTASGTFSPLSSTGNTQVGGASATATAYADAGNAKFTNGFLVQNFSTGVAAAGTPLLSFSNTQQASPFSYGSAYSMTVQLTYTIPNNVVFNGRSNVIQALGTVPEPSSVVMIGMGAAALFGLSRYRRRTGR